MAIDQGHIDAIRAMVEAETGRVEVDHQEDDTSQDAASVTQCAEAYWLAFR